MGIPSGGGVNEQDYKVLWQMGISVIYGQFVDSLSIGLVLWVLYFKKLIDQEEK